LTLSNAPGMQFIIRSCVLSAEIGLLCKVSLTAVEIESV